MQLSTNGVCLPYGLQLSDGAVLLHRPAEFGPLARFAVGFVYQVFPINIDLLSETEILRMADDVRAILSHLPEGSVLDVRLDYRPKYSAQEWESIREGMGDEHMNLIREHIAAGMPHRPGFNPMSLMECAVTVGFRYALSDKSPVVAGLIDGLRQLAFWRASAVTDEIQHRIETEFQSALNEALTHADSVESGLRQLEMEPERLTGEGLISALNRAMGPEGARPTLYNADELLADQLQPPTVMGPNRIEAGGTRRACLFCARAWGAPIPAS